MTILYIHGLGGGEDSRIPRILRGFFAENPCDCGEIKVICHTYSFDPEVAQKQIDEWVKIEAPALIIGESLGSIQALRNPLDTIPYLFVSPALNAPEHIGCLAWVSRLPGMPKLLNRIYRPKRPNRQVMDFTYGTMRKYKGLRDEALATAKSKDVFAFFGKHDHYRCRGIVSIRKWREYFGAESYSVYDGTHFMEEEYVKDLLIPKILLSLRTKCI